MINIAKIRIIQIERFFKKLGWLYSLFIFFVSFIFFYEFFDLKTLLLSNRIYGISIGFILYICAFFIHINRKDKIFLISRYNYYKLLFFVEYFIIFSPIIILFIISRLYIESILFILLLILLVNYDKYDIYNYFNLRNTTIYITLWIDEKYYEWLSGIRKYWVGILIMYIIATVLVYFNYLSIIFIWGIIVLIIPSFYTYFEPLIFLESQQLSAGTFLFRKISGHFFLSLVLIAPFSMIYYFFHSTQYIFLAITVLISLIVITWLNYFKYYAYKHIKETPIFYKYIVTSGAFLILPFLPFFLIVMINKWKRLKSNIEFYTDV